MIWKTGNLIPESKLVEKLVEKLGVNEWAIIKEISKDSKITISELSQIVGISTTAIENNIAKLKEKGILKRIGPDKGGHWEVNLKNR